MPTDKERQAHRPQGVGKGFEMYRKHFSDLMAAIAIFGFFAFPLILVYKPVHFEYGLIWAISTLLLTLILLLSHGRSLVGNLLLAGLAFAVAFLNVSLVSSFSVQGTPFNHAFISHLDLSTLSIAWQTDAVKLSAAIVYLCLSPIVGFLVAARRFHLFGQRLRMPRWLSPIAVIAMLLTSYPLISIAEHIRGTRMASDRIEKELGAILARQEGEEVTASDVKNIVLIYLESVEQNYLDDGIFEGLTPFLNDFRANAQAFTNVQQFPGTEWTVGGMVGSQCGVPLLAGNKGNKILSEVENPFSEIKCLAEYLSDFSYSSVYLGGATLDFAGKGNFLRDNGFSVVLGSDELSDAGSNKWGMYDVDLYRHAKRLYDGLAEQPHPFILSLLTLDTHHPHGTPSPGCPAYGASDIIMLSAVHCADILLQDFLTHVEGANGNGRETIIAIVSDHLLIFGDAVPQLESKTRHITFMVKDPSRAAAEHSMPATHFDIAPTMLEMAGITGAEFAFGQSLISNDKGRVFADSISDSDFQAFSVDSLVSN